MAATEIVPQLLARNEEYAKTHEPILKFTELPPDAVRPHTIIFCCMDGRVHPEKILGLKPGEALLVRNAGGDVARNIADLLYLGQLINIKEVLVIQHTDCGITYLSDEQVHAGLKEHAPSLADEIDAINFNASKDVYKRAKDDVAYLKNHPLIKKEVAEKVVGAVYDIKTGTITRV